MKDFKRACLGSTAYAMAVIMGAAVAVPAVSTLASAQDYTSGGVVGTVVDPNGSPVAGADVTLTSQAQGFSRNLTTDANGAFRATLLPQGSYEVTISAPGYAEMSDTIAIRVGGLANYTFNAVQASETETIVVTGTAVQQLQFQQTTSGLNVDVEDLVATLPVGRNIESIIELAPTVVASDLDFRSPGGGGAGAAAIGGSSAAENAFYINGLNITNFDTYLGGATVPFDFYQTVEVKNGGYPAEYGRATGGVVNAVTKSGTNEFEFGIHGNWSPDALRSDSPDTYRSRNALDQVEERDLILEAGGPIVPDRLFFYGLYQVRDNTNEAASIAAGTYSVYESDDPFFGIKLDGYLTDNHHFEATYFDTTRETTRTDYTFDGVDEVGTDPAGSTLYENGGPSYVFKYTGSLSDAFTISAAYGVSEDRHSVIASDPDTPYVVDVRSGSSIRVGTQTSDRNDFNDTRREFYRVDGDLFFDFMGSHHVRAGYENERLSLDHLLSYTGGALWQAFRVSDSTSARYGLPAGADVIRGIVGDFGGSVEGENEAFYIQDSWDVTDRLNLQLGVRNDHFVLENLVGDVPVDLDNNWGARIGFNYDLFDDSRTRLFGSYGRYYIPPALNMSYRGADLYVYEYFELLSLDAATGEFVLGDVRSADNSEIDVSLGAAACPEGALSPAGTVSCIILGNGSQEPAFSKTSQDLRATYEDEFSLGVDHQLNDDWTIGARATWRVLGDVSEDVAIDDALIAWCAENGIAGCGDIWTGDYQYVIMNPGEAIDVYTREPLPGESAPRLIHLTEAQLDLPEGEREYVAFELSFDRAFDGVWGLRGSYVWSSSTGNYEGTVLSDNGQDDAGTTILYDHPGLTDNAYGFLPNHRRHQFKLWGSYQLTDDLLLGSYVSVTSPRQYGCLGVHPTEASSAGYGASSRYCQGRAVRRGTAFESDWETRLDLSARYAVPMGEGRGDLVLRADVFNVLGLEAGIDYQEEGDTDSGSVNANYGAVLDYQAPRSVRVGFDWTF